MNVKYSTFKTGATLSRVNCSFHVSDSDELTFSVQHFAPRPDTGSDEFWVLTMRTEAGYVDFYFKSLEKMESMMYGMQKAWEEVER